MRAALKEREAGLAGCLKRWEHWGVRLDPTDETHDDSMDMPFL